MIPSAHPDKRVEKTRRRLRKALLTQLQHADIKRITISDLTKAAGVDRSTFYNHYESVSHLLDQIIDDAICDLTRACRKPFQEKRSFKIKDLEPDSLSSIFESVLNHQDVYFTLIQSSMFPQLPLKLTEAFTKLILNDYSFHYPKVNRQLHAAFYANAMTGLIMHWVKQSCSTSPHEMAVQLIRIMKAMPTQKYVLKRR